VTPAVFRDTRPDTFSVGSDFGTTAKVRCAVHQGGHLLAVTNFSIKLPRLPSAYGRGCQRRHRLFQCSSVGEVQGQYANSAEN
jgi:hypothetical protein